METERISTTDIRPAGGANYFVQGFSWLAILIALYVISNLNYLLFHGLAELSSVIIAGAIFTIAWNSRHLSSNKFLLLSGISLLFVAIIDLLHILTYKGMGVFPGIGNDIPTQLWLGARYLQSFSLLAATLLLFDKKQRPLRAGWVFLAYSVLTILLLLSIFYWQNFPAAFLDGSGLTPFKKISEYAICAVLLCAIFPLVKKERAFDKSVFWLIIWSLATMTLSEFSFTLYTDPYGLFNKIGHLLKILSFYFLYHAIVVANFKNPFALLFKNLKQKELALLSSLKESRTIADSLKISEQLYQDALVYTQSIIDTVRQPLLVLDEKMKIDSANKSFYDFFWTTPEEIEKKQFADIFGRRWDVPELINRIQETFVTGQSFSNFELKLSYRRIGQKILLFSGKRINRRGKKNPLFLLSLDDMTEWKEAEEKIEHLASFPQLNPNPVIEIDLSGRIIFANPVATELAIELSGQEDARIFLPEDILEILKTFNQAGSPQILYREHRVKNRAFNETIHFLKKLSVVRIYTADITQLKETEENLRETKEYLEKLIDHANAPIIVWNPRNEIIQFNHAFESLTGYLAPEVIGQKLDFLFPPASKKESLEKILLTTEGANWEVVEIPILRKDQAIRIVLWNSANIYNNYYDRNKKTLIATIAQGQDITELKRIDRAKTEFISLAAHQLRTPLATIGLTAEMLLRGVTGQTDKETGRHLASIQEDIRGMAELIETFLNVSRIEMGTFPIEPEPADLIKSIDAILKNISPQIDNKRLILEKDYSRKSLVLNLDQRVLRVALDNLLTNAVKYTDAGGTIGVSVSADKNEVVIKISDNGWGIPKDQQDKIFEKMYRASNVQNTKAEGVGLGLYMVKAILEQANGRIRLESEEKKGTAFFISLPLKGMTEKKKVSPKN